MNNTIYLKVCSVLQKQFSAPAENMTPDASLQNLGLDSLALMEFVFALEDEFDMLIPEDRLDPRQSGVTLGQLCELIGQMVHETAVAPVAQLKPVAA